MSNVKSRRHEGARAEISDASVPRSIVVKSEPHFERDLLMRHPVVFDMTARLHHLEPSDLPSGRDARPRAFRIASSMLFSEEPAT